MIKKRTSSMISFDLNSISFFTLAHILMLLFNGSLAVKAINNNNDNDCMYECNSSTERPWITVGHEFTSNGCGTREMKVSVDPRIPECCDIHDACYEICGISRNFCDKKFNQCMNRRCEGDRECMSSASMITMGVAIFGCSPFISAQQQACDCISIGNQFQTRVLQTLLEFRSKLPEKSKKSEKQLQESMKKYHGKEEIIIYKNLRRYAKYLIGEEEELSKIDL